MRKVAIVTGATRGIGKAAALELARRGFAVAVTGRTKREGDGRLLDGQRGSLAVPGSIETTVREIEACGGEALGLEMDISNRRSIDAMISVVLDKWGQIDGLFNNAMYQSPFAMAPIEALDADIAEEAMRSMFINHFHITKTVIDRMLAQGHGRIVFISSGAGATACTLRLEEGGWGMLYAAGKAAFSKLAEFVDLEYRDRGIASFHIQPGLTVTEALMAQYGEAARSLGGGQPSFTPHDTGRTVAWLLDAPDALRFAGPRMHFAPTFFADNGLA
jgi:NAD(P)-dependent dehydrogenase (short-subunit alcohol dehydrogenase family)